MSNPVSAVAGPVISVGFGVARVPVGLLARVTGHAGDPEWGPFLVVDVVEAGVRQVLASLLRDPDLAGPDDAPDPQAVRRDEDARHDEVAANRRRVAAQRAEYRLAYDRQVLEETRERGRP